jgi:signal peptidase II
MMLFTASIAFLVLALDRLTKIFVLNNMFQGQSVKVIPGVFHFTLVLNTGAAFGILKDQRAVFIALSVIVVAFIILYTLRRKTRDTLLSVSLGLILGGALGNMIDRIWFGHVIDFLDLRIWPVFNVADSCITIGTVILIVSVFKSSKQAL